MSIFDVASDICSKLIKEVMNKKLTNREKVILELISLGYTDREISSKIYLSPHTVKGYRKQLISKFNSRNACALIRKAFEMQILPLGFQS